MRDLDTYIKENFYRNVGASVTDALNSLIREPENRDTRFEPTKDYFTLENNKLYLNVENFQGHIWPYLYHYNSYKAGISTSSYVYNEIKRCILEREDNKKIYISIAHQVNKNEICRLWIWIWDSNTEKILNNIHISDIKLTKYRGERII